MRLKPWIPLLLACITLPVSALPGITGSPTPETQAKITSCSVPVETASAADLMGRSAVCLDQRNHASALVLYHAGLLRLSAMAQADPGSTERKALIAAFRLVLDRPLIGRATGHIPQWISLMGEAMAWDQSQPFPEGDDLAQKLGVLPDQWVEMRFQERMKLMASINELSRDRERIYLARTQAKAQVRDPSWTPKRRIEVALQTMREVAAASKPKGSGSDHDHEDESTPEPDAPRGAPHTGAPR